MSKIFSKGLRHLGNRKLFSLHIVFATVFVSFFVGIVFFQNQRETQAQTATIVDPTRLPLAQSGTGSILPSTATVGNLQRALSAGQTYTDPYTGVRVMRLTSNSVPESGSQGHGYSEGGPRISQPWTSGGQTYRTVSIESGWLVDIRESDFTVSNWRTFPGGGEVGIAFSLNPATPRIVYYSSNGNVRRYDTATMAEANTAGWPWVIPISGSMSGGGWLQTQVNDTWIAAMKGSTFVAYRQGDQTTRTMSPARSGLSHDEFHLDKELPIIYMSVNNERSQNSPWNLTNDTFITNPAGSVPGSQINADDHAGTVRGAAVNTAHWESGGGAFYYRGDTNQITKFISNTAGFHFGSNDWYTAGHWVFNQPSPAFTDQWFVADRFLGDDSGAKIRRGMIGLVQLTGEVRLVAAHGTTAGGYDTYPQTTFSPDGHYVMWTSDMNGSGRYDVFVAELPTTGSTTPPPTPTPPPPTPTPPTPTPPPPTPTPPPPTPTPTPTPPASYTAPSATITVDGNLSDWSGVSPSITFNVGNNVVTSKLAWNSSYLFASHNVTDTDLRATATIEDNVYLDDEIELFIDTLNNRGSAMGTDDYQFLLNANNIFADLRGTGNGKDIGYTSSGVLRAVTRIGTLNNTTADTSYAIEMAIPWSLLGRTPAAGISMGMNIGASDRDASATNIANWAGAVNWNTPSLWETLILGTASITPSPTPPTPPPTPTPTPTPIPVVGDLNLDHIVNSIDWSIMSSRWFTSDATADLNHDGIVNSIDFSILNSNWFRTW